MKNLGFKARLKLISAIALTILLGVFVFLNMEVVEVNVIIAKISIRRSIMIFSAFGIGLLLGWAVNPLGLLRAKLDSKDT